MLFRSVAKINQLVAEKKGQGIACAVIACEETKDRYEADVVLSMGTRTNEDEIAQHLYGILRQCDDLSVGAIYSESFSTPRIGNAIMNRMLKAAGHQVILV